MKKLLVTICLLFTTVISIAQLSSDMSIFKPLLNKKWVAEESWENVTKFKQEVVLKYKLDEKIVITKTKGFTDKAQTKYGLRNYGIRLFDVKNDKIKFWEYDVFGGVTEGVVYGMGKDIYYEYNYDGQIITDKWGYVNDSTYMLTIGTMHGDRFHNVFIKTQFHARGIISTKKADTPDFNQLLGSWTSKAWDGEIKESWKVGSDGQLHQKAKYLEKGNIKYESRSRIEWIGDELILISIIKNNNPKIFKASSIVPNEIVFENSEYKNPSKVIYKFNADGTFDRTITGKENGKPSTYIFKFKRKFN